MEAHSGMRRPESPDVSLTDADLDFVIGLAAPNARDPTSGAARTSALTDADLA